MVFCKGEKPFVCNGCQKAFTQISSLKYHSYIHTGELTLLHSTTFCTFNEIFITFQGNRQFKCKLCDKSFGKKDRLMKHAKSHIDIKRG